MALLFLESCELGFTRWIIEGDVEHSLNEGLIQKKAFLIRKKTTRFANKIIRQFRDTNEHYEHRKFRLSFWMKTTGNPTKETEFVSLFSKKENQGGMIGLDKTGRFYVGYLCENNEWNGKLVEANPNQPSVTDGKFHFVEFDIVWDNSPAAHIIVYVDNKVYIQRLGVSIFDERFCWSRPDSLMFGNIAGCDLIIDDIILWDDKGTEYVGPKGPKRIQYSEPLSFTPTMATEKKQYLFETFIPNQSRAGLITAVLSETAGSMSDVSIVFKSETDEITGPPQQVLSENDNIMTFVVGAQEHPRTWIGIEKK